jgi:hypothetical protein
MGAKQTTARDDDPLSCIGLFRELPIEMLIEIVRFLEIRDVMIFSSTCTFFHKFLGENRMWRVLWMKSKYYNPSLFLENEEEPSYREVLKRFHGCGWRFSQHGFMFHLKKGGKRISLAKNLGSIDFPNKEDLRYHYQLAISERSMYRGEHYFALKIHKKTWGFSVGITRQPATGLYAQSPFVQIYYDSTINLSNRNLEVVEAEGRERVMMHDGDILGLYCNLDERFLQFFLNGKHIATVSHLTPPGNCAYHFAVQTRYSATTTLECMRYDIVSLTKDQFIQK